MGWKEGVDCDLGDENRGGETNLEARSHTVIPQNADSVKHMIH